MESGQQWAPLVSDFETIRAHYPNPIDELASGRIPALIIRQAFKPNHCSGLIKRFYERGLLYDPRQLDSDKIPRVDIGTSLGTHGKDREHFFRHAEQTHRLFSSLFDGYDDPIKFIYTALSTLIPEKNVVVAHERDGSYYGPAIFRTYYEGVGHSPHFDSVSKRGRLSDYAVSGFDKQFAAVLCFQTPQDDGETGHAVLYNRQWTPDLQDVLKPIRSIEPVLL